MHDARGEEPEICGSAGNVDLLAQPNGFAVIVSLGECQCIEILIDKFCDLI
jgi:hypothetical protein